MLRKVRSVAWVAVAVAALAVGFAGHGQQPAAAVNYQGTNLSGQPAPNFSLVDQKGAALTLDQFRGRTVVLTFMDSRCQDICPLIAQELLAAYQRLSPRVRNDVVFLGVNVNVQYNKVSDVLEFTRLHGLDKLPTWHYATGSEEQLRSVWKAYGIEVLPPGNGASELVHTGGLYLIDRQGEERWYLSASLEDDPAAVGQLIARRIEQVAGR